MVKEYYIIKMEKLFMMVNGLMENMRVKENIYIIMVIIILDLFGMD